MIKPANLTTELNTSTTSFHGHWKVNAPTVSNSVLQNTIYEYQQIDFAILATELIQVWLDLDIKLK